MLRAAIAFFVIGLPVYALGAHAATHRTPADENVGEKVEGKAGDLQTDAKKSVRKMKRKHRKATGQDTVGDDLKDGANNVSDEVSNGAKKAKNKVD
jgi:hypothetical protein